MRELLVAILLACLLGGGPAHAKEESPPELRRLKVLYAGDPESPRTERFSAFLRKWVGKVETTSLVDLDEAKAAGFDVVVADWHRRYDEDGIRPRKPHSQALPHDFKTPVVMLGAVGGEVARWSKFDWL